MKDKKRSDTPDQKRVLAALSELIEALDRRVPHVERLGEVRIAKEAAALRQEAIARIEQLSTPHDVDKREAELADATMADDGGPLRAR